MPANSKYLSSPAQRLVKIIAGFIGGYFVTVSAFMTMTLCLDRAAIMGTLIFGGFIIWAALLIGAFLFRNGWLALGVYILLGLAFSSIYYAYYPG